MSSGLSLAFIDRKPLSAARALAALSLSDAADFLQSIPTRYAARVLARSSAWPASKMLEVMQPEAAAAVLRALPYLDSVAILRLLAPTQRGALLAELPKKLQRDLQNSLAYPADTVGAHMSLNIVAVKANLNVDDARNAVAKAAGVNTDTVFLIDGARRLHSAIAICEVLRHAPETPLSSLPTRATQPLLARQSLKSALAMDAWQDHASLPVLGRRRHLVGSLPIRQLIKASPQPVKSSMPLSTLTEAYFGSAGALLDLLSGTKSAAAKEQSR